MPGTPLASCSPSPGYVSDFSDCNDADAGNWGTPSEARDLTFSDNVTLSWSTTSIPWASASALSYDVIRSSNPADFVSGSTCVSSDAPGTSAVDNQIPPLATRFYYLVRAQNGCPAGQGPLGNASNGAAR